MKRTYTTNVENWRFKTKAEVEALPKDELEAVRKDLYDTIKLFHQHGTPMTDEMFWLMIVLPNV